MSHKLVSLYIGDGEYYTRTDADKVIAEKDKEIAELQKQVHDYAQGLYVIQARAEKEACYNKYKRCLAMAKYCDYRFMNLEKMINTEYRTKKMRLSQRWLAKWLKLADKFKEAK